MKIVNRRAAGSRQTSAQGLAERRLRGGRLAQLRRGRGAVSTPQTASVATAKAIAQTVAVTAISRVFENGSRKCPASGAVIAKPRIIIIQTADAAAARRRGATRVASIARTEVPAEPAPTPTSRNDSAASATAERPEVAASAVPSAAPIAAERERGHAADDPGRPPSADVGPIAPGRPQDLNRVMRGDQQPRNQRGQERARRPSRD